MLSSRDKSSIQTSAVSMIMRRPKLSASAPEGSENKTMGKVVEACTSATRLRLSDRLVISQAAATP